MVYIRVHFAIVIFLIASTILNHAVLISTLHDNEVYMLSTVYAVLKRVRKCYDYVIS